MHAKTELRLSPKLAVGAFGIAAHPARRFERVSIGIVFIFPFSQPPLI
jgi:hypothetical protein